MMTRHFPPESEQEFERLCLLLLRKHWNCPDLQLYGRRGQRQQGIDILDTSGRVPVLAAQCKNYNPIEALTPGELRAAVDKAREFRIPLQRLDILTTAKRSTDTQMALIDLNRRHAHEKLFIIRLKTWDEIELLLHKYGDVAEEFYGGEMVSALKELRHDIQMIATELPPISKIVSAAAADASFATFNRVLVRWPAKTITEHLGSGKEIMYQDYSIALLTIEELVSVGAMELAVDFSASEFPSFLESMPSALRDRVVFVGDASLRARVEKILSPVYEELGIESIAGGFGLTFHKSNHANDEYVMNVFSNLYDFLVGARNYLQIDINFPDFLVAVNRLRHNLRNPAARANLAVIEGILRTYENQRIDSIGVRSSAAPRAAALFAEFAGLEPYRELSRAARAIGNPEKLVQASREFSQISREFVQSRDGEQTLQLTNKRILASTGPGNENPATELRLQLNPEGFLPPIISFASVRARAGEAYDRLKPSPLVHDAIKRHRSDF
jgi:hypothetical protein